VLLIRNEWNGLRRAKRKAFDAIEEEETAVQLQNPGAGAEEWSGTRGMAAGERGQGD